MAPTNGHLAVRSADHNRPTVADLQGDNHYTQFARKTWLSGSAVNAKTIKPDFLKKELWDVLESEGFQYKSLLILENLQCLESYLWPGYSDDASNFHVLLISLIVNVKAKENLPVWDSFSDRSSDFSTLFRRILSMSLDFALPTVIRTHLLCFIISAFQSLDNGLLRKECAPLVSIAIWHNLSSESLRDSILDQRNQLKKAWRAAAKRHEAADETTKARIRFDRSWLYSMTLDFLNRLYTKSKVSYDDLLYCERFIELLADLESQLPTRRYVNALIMDLHVLPALKLSPIFNEEGSSLLRDLAGLLRHYVYFSIDDHSGAQRSMDESYEVHCKTLAKLQRVAMKHFKSKLTILALSNYAAIDKRSDLDDQLSLLDDQELEELCNLMAYRTRYPKSTTVTVDREFLKEILVTSHERKKTFQEVAKDLSICPTEKSLSEVGLIRNAEYNGTRPLALPKLNLQYLTVGDFLWRSFILHRCESFFEIKEDVEDALRRLQPRMGGSKGEIRFDGHAKMALPVSKPAIVDVAPPKVGDKTPAFVRAEISLDVSRLNDNVRREWESLRPDDVIFLLAVKEPPSTSPNLVQAASDRAGNLGLTHVRAAEVVQVLDEQGRALRQSRDAQTNGNSVSHRPRSRRLLVNIDSAAYQLDRGMMNSGTPSIYDEINVVVRRRGRENNFKPVLESIRSLTLSHLPVPSWLQEVFLGYGDPASANYKNLPNRLESIDFRDTFLDWEHLKESFPGMSVEPKDGAGLMPRPPYVLEISSEVTQPAVAKPLKKRRRDQADSEVSIRNRVVVSTYKPPNTGPYPTDAPKLNQIRFTPAQVEAIVSGMQPGLTCIVGPPGTGKTDVTVQIINNLYHDFPEERVLLLAHSNQALNQLFQKIMALDVDERHLLRLGHGEEDLATDANYSKHGRVESFLENRERVLAEVDRLAASFEAPGAHGSSCETAGYFESVYVKPAWKKFQDETQSAEATANDIRDAFPFHSYFSTAPQPLFPEAITGDEAMEIAVGCYRHVQKIFSELADIRPFELLRSPRDKANYLLVKEARIIAMTSTHAAMRRQEIESLGFHYDNVVMEEAAQITEIETFLPLALQSPKDGELPLKRVVLCGDHLQNSPVIQNLALRQYANLEQSLFLRLIRLGVPVVNLDRQGRARPAIADLYRWRYKALGDLPMIHSEPEFLIANAGLRYEYQFIDVPDYHGAGESEPTPHFIQNLGEAEYCVALYQYMRLLGYPASSISILATYAGQRSLIRDVLDHRCARNRLFGLPKTVTTVDQYQGEQNDYVILSLTRTTRVGYLRDIRRLTVALSRARLGLYVFGRRDVFETCYELKGAFDRLFRRFDKLMLTTGELYPCTRAVSDDVDGTEMDGVEHLGKYVYEMSQARLAST